MTLSKEKDTLIVITESQILRNIQEELTNHLKIKHTDIIDSYDPDSFPYENDRHQEFLDLFVQA